jgi:tetratricopeptide (TPR) repeat protein
LRAAGNSLVEQASACNRDFSPDAARRLKPSLQAKACSTVLALFLLSLGCSQRDTAALLTQHRNLGKAYYENPAMAQEAVREFQQALQLAPNSAREKVNYALALLRASGRDDEAVRLLLDAQEQEPSLPHTWFNLGIYHKRRGDVSRAIQQFEGMIARAPAEAIGHYQLGALYRQANRNAEAQAQFERAAELDPQLAAAPFQLYNLERVTGNNVEASRSLANFQRIQAIQKTWVTPEDVEWCQYAEIYDPPEARPQSPPPPEPMFADTRLDAAASGLALIDSTGAGQTDLLVWSPQGVRLYLRGQQLANEIGLDGLSNVSDVAPGDFDNDGLMDLCVVTASGPILLRNTGGKFSRVSANLPTRRFEKAIWLDYDHDYDLDLVLLGDQPVLMRNQGAAGWADRTADLPFSRTSLSLSAAQKLRVDPDSKSFDLAVFYRGGNPILYRDQLGGRYTVEPFQGTPPPATQVEADFDGDGLPDRARIDTDGSLHLLRNVSNSNRRWIRVRLTGVRSLKTAQDALVEIKAGNLYRREFYTGVPLLFDAEDHVSVDTVRITWPNGLIQNEVRQATNQPHAYVEAQRLSGSCPMVWTWNGREFQFITDVLGVAPLGASDGDGTFFPVNHVEYVHIPPDALVAKDGRYDVHLTEELSEVSYLDQIQLLAVDHPTGVEIFTNEKFKGPPYPEFKLFGVQHRIYPASARDDQGRDVLPQLKSLDQHYPDQFHRSETGIADEHTLELDFGSTAPSPSAILLLNGWVDWPDGSTFRRASQESKEGLMVPYLQVQDVNGRWVTIDQDMGMPAGKPKTIVVPVKFLSSSRKVRIATNLCVYWDEIFLSEAAPLADVTLQQTQLLSADLHFRGFSETRIDPSRMQPDTFIYQHVTRGSFWNPTPGLYTRYGPVDEILRGVDDRLVLMGSGDEVSLQFEALGAPREGWSRDFLLKVDGWAKDRDANTAFSQTVMPLPFHGMSRYPYPSNESYPRDAVHDSYQRTYNTRPQGMLIEPLATR